MRCSKIFYIGIILFFCLTSFCFAEDYPLHYFLSKTALQVSELDKKERDGLLNRIDEVIEKAQQVHTKLTLSIQTGEVDIRYQEGRFWIAKLEDDKKAFEMAVQQIKLLKETSTHLVASITLYKSLRDVSSNFNAYNNMPSFSAWVGDLAPDMELWADPVFYKLYLLPLAHLKEKEEVPPNKEEVPPKKEESPPQKEKKPVSKGKKP